MPQVRWTRNVPAGVIHYTFEWSASDCSSGKDETETKPTPAPGERAGRTELWMVQQASGPLEIANIAIGDTGAGYDPDTVLGRVPDFDHGRIGWLKIFLRRYSVMGRQGRFSLTVEVRASLPTDKLVESRMHPGTPAQLGQLGYGPSTLNNVNRVWHGGLDYLNILGEVTKPPADWDDPRRAVLARYTLAGTWCDGAVNFDWHDSAANQGGGLGTHVRDSQEQ
jgi:hypothetical protein